MNNNVNIKKLVLTGLLTAFAIIIPIYMGFLRVYIPPFSATLTAHVPMFFAMFLGPGSAVVVGLGSAFGFLITLGPVIATRAMAHVFVGLAGAIMLKKGVSFNKVVAITAPLHGVLESLALLPFGIGVYKSAYFVLVITGVGTILHHCIDGFITAVLVKALSKSLGKDFKKNFSTSR